MIFILEDNETRIHDFRAVVASGVPQETIRFWRSAHQMIDDLPGCLSEASLISLDHDLNEIPGDMTDPGTGYDVAKLLGELIPVCPIIIHTSNAERGTWMSGELTRAGWIHERVYPFGTNWIQEDWLQASKRLLALG